MDIPHPVPLHDLWPWSAFWPALDLWSISCLFVCLFIYIFLVIKDVQLQWHCHKTLLAVWVLNASRILMLRRQCREMSLLGDYQSKICTRKKLALVKRWSVRVCSPQGQYWAGRTPPPNNPPPNTAAANFLVITNGEGCALNGTAVAALLIDQ